jgi:hypothetical protein
MELKCGYEYRRGSEPSAAVLAGGPAVNDCSALPLTLVRHSITTRHGGGNFQNNTRAVSKLAPPEPRDDIRRCACIENEGLSYQPDLGRLCKAVNVTRSPPNDHETAQLLAAEQAGKPGGR